MCGIVCVIQKNWDKPLGHLGQRVFKQMLFANALRGTDGTGYFYYNNKTSKVIFQKLPVPSWEAIPKMPELDKLMSDGRWVVGHNRKATAGQHTEANTHPFIDEFITLVHNGTLSNHWDLEKDVGNEDVDSKLIPKLMNKYGNKKALELLQGAYALVWYDDTKRRIFFARNEERPLFIVETDDFYVLSSEEELATWILSRNSLDVTRITETQPGYIYALGENKHRKLFIHKTKFTPAKQQKPAYKNSFGYQQDYDYTTDYNKQASLPLIQPELAPNYYSYKHNNNNANNSLLKARYKSGDTIIVKVDSIVQTYYSTRIKATTVEKPHVAVDILVSGSSEKFNTEYVSCVVSSYITTIFAKDPSPVYFVEKSGNGVEISPIIYKELDMQRCSSCGEDSYAYFQDSFVAYDEQTKTYSYECPKCSWENHSEVMLTNYLADQEGKAYAA